MILFIFEGNKREPQLFDSIQKLFFPKDNDAIVCSFGNNIYELYRQLEELGGDGDVVSILREKYYDKEDNPFEHITASSDFSEIYLFFDYDFHNQNYPLSELNRQLEEMLRLFDNETENGKLYINYPMVESIRYTKQLPDKDYWTYTVSRDGCKDFKRLAGEFSAYNSLDFICIPARREPTVAEINKAKTNWDYLKIQNVCKANYICSGDNNLPETLESISQGHVFHNQQEKFVNGGDICKVSILNAFPLFLYEYFGRI